MGALCALVHLYLRLCKLVIKKLVQIDVLVHLCALVHLCTLVHLHLHLCRFVQQKNLCRLVAVIVETNSFEDSLGALRPFLGAFSFLFFSWRLFHLVARFSQSENFTRCTASLLEGELSKTAGKVVKISFRWTTLLHRVLVVR